MIENEHEFRISDYSKYKIELMKHKFDEKHLSFIDIMSRFVTIVFKRFDETNLNCSKVIKFEKKFILYVADNDSSFNLT